MVSPLPRVDPEPRHFASFSLCLCRGRWLVVPSALSVSSVWREALYTGAVLGSSQRAPSLPVSLSFRSARGCPRVARAPRARGEAGSAGLTTVQAAAAVAEKKREKKKAGKRRGKRRKMVVAFISSLPLLRSPFQTSSPRSLSSQSPVTPSSLSSSKCSRSDVEY